MSVNASDPATWGQFQWNSARMEQGVINVGLIGYGFMGRTHSYAYLNVGKVFGDIPFKPVMKAVCARNKERVEAFQKQWGWETYETDWRKLIERADIDAIDIGSPNDTHLEIAIAAAKAGKIIFCEKPLALNGEEGAKMVKAIQEAGVPNVVWYNYRRVPAVTLAKRIVDSGALGRIFHYRANFLQDWTIDETLGQGGEGLWRLDIAAAGSGVTGDLLAHCIDTAIWLNGSIASVAATTETFVKERKHNLTGETQPVGIDDACAFLAKFTNGSQGLFESTRYARGHKALYTFEINGEHGSIKWDLHDLHRLEVFEYTKGSITPGWKNVHVTDGDAPYMSKWWVPGLQIGYGETFVHQLADFLGGLKDPSKLAGLTTFAGAQETQKVCDAVLKSAKDLPFTPVG